MIADMPLLTFLIWLPVLGGILVLMTGDDQNTARSRWVALAFALLNLALCVPLYLAFNADTAGMQFQETMQWIPFLHIQYALGVDGISMPLIILTAFTTVLIVLSAWRTVETKVSQYLATFLIMQGMVIGIFSALDAVLFYFFWEATLIPMYLAIGVWGSANRTYAAIKFFLFTFFGSALMLVALLFLGIKAGSFYIPDFYALQIGMTPQILIFIAFLLAFAVKVPMWPVHTWLPDAHTEAPAGGSIILAALMLKVGGYGFLRLSLPIVPDASHALSWFMIALSLVAIVYIGFIAIVQSDMKKLIAYSSVAHMGFVTLGIFVIYVIVSHAGAPVDAHMVMEGAMIQMISHAFGSGALFLAFGLLYHKMHTRAIHDFGGIANTMPIFAAFFLLFAMSNVGLPGTAGFVGEFMVILGAFKARMWISALAATTVIIGAAYTLWMYKRVFFGPVANDNVAALKDVDWFDIATFSLLGLAIIGFGLFPNAILNVFHASVSHLVDISLQSRLG